MFKVVSSPRAWWPVTFSGVLEDGTVVQNSFEMLFKVLDEDQHIALTNRADEVVKKLTPKDAADANEQGDVEGQAASEVPPVPLLFSELAAEFVPEFAHDWRQVAYENGDPMKFETENIRTVVKLPNVWRAMWEGYRDCRKAAPKVRAGN